MSLVLGELPVFSGSGRRRADEGEPAKQSQTGIIPITAGPSGGGPIRANRRNKAKRGLFRLPPARAAAGG